MEINKEEVKSRFRRSIGSYDANARIQKIVVERLSRIVSDCLNYRPGRILEIGCGTGLFTKEITRVFPGRELYVNDLVEELCHRTAAHFAIDEAHRIPGDIEQVVLPSPVNLVVSASTFQWLADPGEMFRKLAGILHAGELMIFSTFGKYNLREIRLTVGGGLNYRSQEEVMELLEPWFRVEQIHEEFRLLEFTDPLAILQHLKRTGVNVSGDSTVWTKGRVSAFIDEYNHRFAMDGKVTLTYHPLYLVCRRKAF